MKKLLSVILSLFIIFTLASCKKNDLTPDKNNDSVSKALEYKLSEVESGCKALGYDMELTLDTKNDTVYGVATVELENKTSSSLSEICFRYFAPAMTQESEIKSIKNAESGKNYELSFEADNTFIKASLGDDAVAAGEKISLAVDFISYFPTDDSRFNCFTYDMGKLYNMTFCFPQVSFLEDGNWFKGEYIESGESLYNEMADYTVSLTAPDDYVVVSSGKSETVDGVTTINAENIREMAITACNFAEIETKEKDGITYNLLKPAYEYSDKTVLEGYYEIIMATAVESVEMFSEKVGDYIYDELDIVPMAFSGNIGGMEMPGLVQVSMAAKDLDATELWNEIYSTVASTCHEVGHQWFYCAVGNDQADETWLDESFTSYLEVYYCEHSKDALKTAEALGKKIGYLEADATLGSIGWGRVEGDAYYINLPAYSYSNDEYIYIYECGADFFIKLAETMGEEKFFEMLSDWYSDNVNEIVEGYAFIQHVLEYDSSDDVKKLINTYISAENLD